MFVFYTLTLEESTNKNKKIESLLNLIANADTNALGELYDLIKTDIYAYALSKLKNKADAEDIMQDTFVNIYRYAKQYQAKGKPLAWIFTIELNLIKRKVIVSTRTTALEDGYENSIKVCDTEDKIIDNDFLMQLLNTLTEEEREIITLHLVSGLKHKEIAKLLNMGLSTILSKYNRAIKKLQIMVREQNL